MRCRFGPAALSARGVPFIARVGDALPIVAAAATPAMLVGGLGALLAGRGAGFAIASLLGAAVLALAADAARDFSRAHRGGGLPGRGSRPLREMLELGVAEQRQFMPPDHAASVSPVMSSGPAGTALLLVGLLLALATSTGAVVRLASRSWQLAFVLTVSAPLSALAATTVASALGDYRNSVVAAGELSAWLLDGVRGLRVTVVARPGAQ
jgi:hypothetical protein